MVISKDFIFVHIPKTGGIFVTKILAQSIEFKFLNYCQKKNYQHKPISYFLQDIDIRNKHWFYVVRNPWDWHLSHFRYIKTKERRNNPIKFKRYPSLYSNNSLDDIHLFNRFIQDKIDGYNNDSLTNQINYIINRPLTKLTVLRLENIRNGLISFLSQFTDLTIDQIRLIRTFNRVNVTNIDNESYKKYYNKEMCDYIFRIESKIIQDYGYSF